MDTQGYKLNPELKAKWLAALRSGKYKQGSGMLRRGDGSFCCLGVFCMAQGARAWHDGRELINISGIATKTPKISFYLPKEYAQEMPEHIQSFLADKNDALRRKDGGWTFLQIADWIEENL